MIRMKRFLVVAVTIPVCYILQMVALPAIPNLIAVPNLLLSEVLTFGFLYGKSYGLACGVVSGLLLDILGTGTIGFYTLILAALGYGDGLLSEKIESEVIPILFGLLTINELLFHLFVFALAFLIRKSFSFGSYALHVFLPELLLTMAGFLLLYGILIFLSKRWDLKVNKGEVKVV